MTFRDSLRAGFRTIGSDIRVKSPEILIGVGIVSILGGVFVGCKNTLKIKEVLDEHNDMIDLIEEHRGTKEYPEEDAIEDIQTLYRNTGVEMVKAYAPVVIMEIVGIGCILKSHSIMKDRYFGALSTINAMQIGYSAYRNRVKEKVGEQEEYDLFHNIKKEQVEEEYVDEKGKKRKRFVDQVVDIGEAAGRFSYMFDRNSWGFKDMYSNKRFMDFAEKQFNQQLFNRGKEIGFANMTVKEITDYFNWTDREKDQFALLSNGFIYRDDEYSHYEKYSDGVPRIIKLDTNPNFGVTEAETWVDINAYPILGAVKDYMDSVNKRNKKVGKYIPAIA